METGDLMNYMEKYAFWKSQTQLDKELQEELNHLSESDMKEVFFSDITFGTGGLRGLMGVGTNRINIYVIRKATLGFARYILKNNIEGGVAISYDNRRHSKTFAFESAQVLAAVGIKSYVFESLRPTPMLSFAVRHFQCAGGIMITASHNPKAYNGYKAYDKTGAQLNIEDAEAVIREINAIDNPFEIETKHNELIQIIHRDFDEIYLNLVSQIALNHETKKVNIVYSPLHGTGGAIIPSFLKKHGYEIHPYEPQMIVDPNFSATQSSNPEEAIAYEHTITYAKQIQADLIMVTDPDADRLGIAVKHDGKYQLLSGNQTAAIELYYILTELKKSNRLPANGFVYTTNVTTDLIKVIAQSFGMKVVTTLTGFKFIGEQAEKNKNIGPYLFGCEESYGSLISDFVRDKDAVQAVFMLAEIANHVKLKGLTLIDYLETIYQTYGYYYEYTKNITLPGLSGLEKITEIMNYFRAHPPVIEGLQLIQFDDIIHQMQYIGDVATPLDLPISNVLKYHYQGDTWITFRPSGTEPKIKIYFGTQSSTMAKAVSLIEQLSLKISKEIERL
jgi:phosphoglucomutase